MAAPRIRRAVPGDRERLAELWIDLIDHHRRLDLDYPPTPGLREAIRRELERGLRSPECRVWIAEDGSGFLFAEVDPAAGAGRAAAGATGWIHELYVEPASRRRGVARALVKTAEAFFVERGVERASVRVETTNPAALEFWTRLDFAERSRILERALR